MKLKSLKLPTGFRGLPKGFELEFTNYFNLKKLTPQCFVGLNGSGKSNVLEVLSEIFYYLETFHKSKSSESKEYQTSFAFEICYSLPYAITAQAVEILSFINDRTRNEKTNTLNFKITKNEGMLPDGYFYLKEENVYTMSKDDFRDMDYYLPYKVIAYSSGMNELISNAFIKTSMDYFDNFKNKSGAAKNTVLSDDRFFFMDYESNKYISICNFLFDSDSVAERLKKERESKPGRLKAELARDEDLNSRLTEKWLDLEEAIMSKPHDKDLLSEIREIERQRELLKSNFNKVTKEYKKLSEPEPDFREMSLAFGGKNLSLLKDQTKIDDLHSFKVKVDLKLGKDRYASFPLEMEPMISHLKNCATTFTEVFKPGTSNELESIELYFWVNDATKWSFQNNFNDSTELYKTFYFLSLLNLNLLSDDLRKLIRRAEKDLNISALLPKPEDKKLLFTVTDICLKKQGVEKPIYYKALSDGEHQLLHVLGSVVLLHKPGALFLLDEPG